MTNIPELDAVLKRLHAQGELEVLQQSAAGGTVEFTGKAAGSTRVKSAGSYAEDAPERLDGFTTAELEEIAIQSL